MGEDRQRGFLSKRFDRGVWTGLHRRRSNSNGFSRGDHGIVPPLSAPGHRSPPAARSRPLFTADPVRIRMKKLTTLNPQLNPMSSHELPQHPGQRRKGRTVGPSSET